jgi:hypothetical protein
MAKFWRMLNGWDVWYDIPSSNWNDPEWTGMRSLLNHLRGQQAAWSIWNQL